MQQRVKKILILLLPVLVGGYPTLGQASSTSSPHKKPIVLNLKDAVLLSIRNNPDLEQAEVQRISQKFSLVEAKNQFEPQYSLNGSANYSNNVENGEASYSKSWSVNPSVSIKNHYGTQFSVSSNNTVSQGIYNPQLELQVTQPLIRGFGKPVVEATLNNAKDSELLNRLNFKSTSISTVTTAINDYLSLVESYQTLKVDQQTLKNYQQTVENDKEMIAAGKKARSEIVQAKAQVASQKSAIQDDLNTINTNKNQLLNDLGLPPRTPITVPDQFDFKKVAEEIKGGSDLPELNESAQIALANNTGYQQANITIRTLRRSLLVDQDNRRWKLDLTASEQLGGGSGGGDNSGVDSLFNGDNHSESVGVNLTVPIDDVSSQGQVIDQKVALQRAQIGLQESKRQLIDEVETDYQSMLSNKRSLQLSRNALKLQQQTVKIAAQKQVAGRISTFEVLGDQQDLSTQQETVVENEINYLQSIVNLEQELGVSLQPWDIKLKY